MTVFIAAAAPVDGEVPFRTTRVVVFEDRADISRSCTLEVSPGASSVTFRGLSPLIDENRLVARLEGLEADAGQVDDVVVRRHRVSDDGGTISEHRRRRTEERDRVVAAIAEVEARVKASERQRETLVQLAAQFAEARAREAGRFAGASAGSVASGDDGIDALMEGIRVASTTLAHTRGDLQRLQHQLGDAVAALKTPEGRSTRPVCDVTVRLSTTSSSKITIVLTTLVPCAAWRPTHEARLQRGATPTVHFTGAGAIWNRTGEAWLDATIELSTKRPSLGAAVPALTADTLSVRTKSAEERRTITVEHRTQSVPRSATRAAAPGVDDGGEVRRFEVAAASIPDDGRPHRLGLFSFSASATVDQVAIPERGEQVFVRASLKNAGSHPILAGPVQVIDDGAFVGTGDLLYVGPGEPFEVSFGSNDALRVSFDRDCVEEKRLVQKNLEHWRQSATLVSTAREDIDVVVTLRLPVSELAQVKVVPSPQHSTVANFSVDGHGLLRVPVRVPAGGEKKVAVAFTFDTSGDVAIPPPW